MKVSLNWIKDYVELPADMDLTRLSYDLTMSTVEVEGVSDLSAQFKNMTVGLIEEVLPHPNADRLKICKTALGGDLVKEIVCGGINVAAGMKVAVAHPGAMVVWHGEGEPVEIKNAKLRGVQSYGMICASSEIGLGDLFPESEEGQIMDLSNFPCHAGQPLAEALELDDMILEIDNKSMTNRPDLWGHYGIARELAAIYDLPLKTFEAYTTPTTARDFRVVVEDAQRCPRYIGTLIEGVSVQPSPFWMQSRIWRVGLRPINALVDITNYCMLALGQPTHAFDADNIHGYIQVRRAREDEKLLLLNGSELKLTTDDLVIADDKSAVGLAGVMGGAKDSVLPTTNRVILEIANFDALSIRRTAARYETRTEAATRYEKALDPQRCELALSMAMSLFSEFYPDSNVTGLCDLYQKPLECAKVTVSLDWLSRRVGTQIPNALIEAKLQKLGFTTQIEGDELRVTAPSYRSTGDISMPADIMEEIVRMIGYENFEAAPITTSFTGAINQVEWDLERRIKEYLAIRAGMQEIFTYPWMQDTFIEAILPSREGMLALASPPSPTERYLRSSLLPNLCQAVTVNQHHYDEFALFETAQILRDEAYEAVYDATELLPMQKRYVAGAFVAPESEINTLFRKAKGVLAGMSRPTHMEALTFVQQDKPYWADANIWLQIALGDAVIGNLGLLSKKAAVQIGIKNKAVVLFELDLESLQPYPSRTNQYTHVPDYPMTQYDISMLFDRTIRWEDILAAIESKKSKLIQQVAFVDEYRGKQVPEDKKSITIRLTIGSLEKTLTSAEIEAEAGKVLKRLEKSFEAKLRDV